MFDEDFDDCWLVDIGDFERVADALPNGKRIKGLLLTHTHFDHIYGINDLCRNYPDCIVYTSKFGKDALMDDKQNLSRYHEHPIVFEGKHLEIVEDESNISFFGEEIIRVAVTPGHTPDCLTFYTKNYIFTGDSYIPNVKVVTKLPGGNREEATRSKEKILRLAHGKTICPGHGEICVYDIL